MSDIKQEQLEKEQFENGQIMDKMQKKEHFLQKHKKAMNADDTFILYKLPLNEKQMEAVYTKLMNEKKD